MNIPKDLRVSLERCEARKQQLEIKVSELCRADILDAQEKQHLAERQTELEHAEATASSLQRQLDDLMD